MRHIQFTTRAILIFMALVSIPCCWVGMRIQEHNRIQASNRKLHAEIFHRCQDIPELKQFIDLYNPEQVLEISNADPRDFSVVRVICAAQIDARYKTIVRAPVSINTSGFYELTGELVFLIQDNQGQFTTIFKDTSITRQAVHMDADQWVRFIAKGADIESLRTFHSPKRLLTF